MGKGLFGKLLCQTELSWEEQPCLQRRLSGHRGSKKQRSREVDGRRLSGMGSKTGMFSSSLFDLYT